MTNTAKTSARPWAQRIFSAGMSARVSKTKIAGTTLCAAIVVCAGVAHAMSAKLATPGWDGVRLPSNEHCPTRGGNGKAPAFKVTGIPTGANVIVVAYYDETYGAKVGARWTHGIIGFRHAGGPTAVLPRVARYRKSLGPNAFVIRNSSKGRTGYHPPCSGGRGHRYTAVVRAVKWDFSANKAIKVLAETRLSIGEY